MSNILKCQESIKNFFPCIENVRIHSIPDKKFGMTVYYEDSNGKFDASLIPKIKEILPCHINFDFKPYNETIIDNVPKMPNVPELIENLALMSNGNLKSFSTVIEKALHNLKPINIKISDDNSKITIDTNCHLSDSDLNKYTLYAQVIAPMGCAVTIVCK